MKIFHHIATVPEVRFMAIILALIAISYVGWWLFDRWVSK